MMIAPLVMAHNEFCSAPSITTCLRCSSAYADDHEGWTCTPFVWHHKPLPEQVEKFYQQVRGHHKPGCKSIRLTTGMMNVLLEVYDKKIGAPDMSHDCPVCGGRGVNRPRGCPKCGRRPPEQHAQP
jgi:hypothetical protein